jgi:cyclic pyranopterin monophosphate synthase
MPSVAPDEGDARIEIDDQMPRFRVTSEVRTKAMTGGPNGSADRGLSRMPHLVRLLRAIDRTMAMGRIEVTAKTGDRSRDWNHK